MPSLVIACDHTAVALKNDIAQYCRDLGWQVEDIGAFDNTACDYPLMAAKAAQMVASGAFDRGIVICGTGVGVSIAANKVAGIRCACCSEPYSAKMSRLHNNANMLAFGARVVGAEMAKMITRQWLEADFEGERHARRVAQINALD